MNYKLLTSGILIFLMEVFILGTSAFSQSLTMWTYSTCASGDPALSWTAGETVIFTGSNGANYLTQGFQQPNFEDADWGFMLRGQESCNFKTQAFVGSSFLKIPACV